MDCGATDIGKGKGKKKKDYTKYHCPHGKNFFFCVLRNGGGLCKAPHCPTIKKKP